MVGSVQGGQARQQAHGRRDGAREVVAAQVPAKPTCQVSIHHRSTRHAGWKVIGSLQLLQRRQRPHVRWDGAREVVAVQDPAKETTPARSVSTIVQHDTQDGVW